MPTLAKNTIARMGCPHKKQSQNPTRKTDVWGTRLLNSFGISNQKYIALTSPA